MKQDTTRKAADQMFGKMEQNEWVPHTREHKQLKRRLKGVQKAYGSKPKDPNAFISNGVWWTMKNGDLTRYNATK
jgi:hypothetical protein